MNNSLAGEEAGLRLNRTNGSDLAAWEGSEREMLSSLTLGFDQTRSRQQTFPTDSIFLKREDLKISVNKVNNFVNKQTILLRELKLKVYRQ